MNKVSTIRRMTPSPVDLTIAFQDGTPVRLRSVRPGDLEHVRRGYREMSRTSRHMRFFVVGEEMALEQARYFTHVDQVNHVALCAVAPDESRGYGIARFIRDLNDPSTAEFAIAVVDDMQGRGLGTLLLAALYLRAKASGVRTLRGDYMATNPVMGHWLPELGATVWPSEDPNAFTIQWPLDEPIDSSTPSAQRFERWVERLRERGL